MLKAGGGEHTPIELTREKAAEVMNFSFSVQ